MSNSYTVSTKPAGLPSVQWVKPNLIYINKPKKYPPPFIDRIVIFRDSSWARFLNYEEEGEEFKKGDLPKSCCIDCGQVKHAPPPLHEVFVHFISLASLNLAQNIKGFVDITKNAYIFRKTCQTFKCKILLKLYQQFLKSKYSVNPKLF